MSEVVISSSSDSDNREIDEYHDSTSDVVSIVTVVVGVVVVVEGTPQTSNTPPEFLGFP